MELIKLDLNNIYMPNNLVACIGVFDGVHCGHSKVINKVIEVAKEKQLKSALITFDPHPDFVLNKISKEQYITPLEDRIKLLNTSFELDYLINLSDDAKAFFVASMEVVTEFENQKIESLFGSLLGGK